MSKIVKVIDLEDGDAALVIRKNGDREVFTKHVPYGSIPPDNALIVVLTQDLIEREGISDFAAFLSGKVLAQ